MCCSVSEDYQEASDVDTDRGPDDKEAVVSDVVASVQALDGQPVEEHVAVFEQAHERLRRALDQQHG